MINADDQAFANEWKNGLTKREYFAAKAMQGIVIDFTNDGAEWDYDDVAKHSVLAADALINALNQTK